MCVCVCRCMDVCGGTCGYVGVTVVWVYVGYRVVGVCVVVWVFRCVKGWYKSGQWVWRGGSRRCYHVQGSEVVPYLPLYLSHYNSPNSLYISPCPYWSHSQFLTHPPSPNISSRQPFLFHLQSNVVIRVSIPYPVFALTSEMLWIRLRGDLAADIKVGVASELGVTAGVARSSGGVGGVARSSDGVGGVARSSDGTGVACKDWVGLSVKGDE